YRSLHWLRIISLISATKAFRLRALRGKSFLARDFLVALVTLLRLHRHRCDWAGFQAAQADRFAGDFAKAIFAVFDAAQRRVDLGDQLALAIAGAQLDRPIGLA